MCKDKDTALLVLDYLVGSGSTLNKLAIIHIRSNMLVVYRHGSFNNIIDSILEKQQLVARFFIPYNEKNC